VGGGPASPPIAVSRGSGEVTGLRGDPVAGLLVLVGDPPFEHLQFDLIPAGADVLCREPAVPNQVKDHVGQSSSSPICATVRNGGPGPRLAAAGGNGPNCEVALETVAAPTPACGAIASKVFRPCGRPPTGQCRLHAAPPSVVLPAHPSASRPHTPNPATASIRLGCVTTWSVLGLAAPLTLQPALRARSVVEPVIASRHYPGWQTSTPEAGPAAM
jgi:hypothetical protein